MNEYYPDLLERIIKREPNAYLSALYWDSEMFGRSSVKRRKLEAGEPEKDYRAELLKLFTNMDQRYPTKHKRHVADRYRNFFLQAAGIMTNYQFKALYEGLIRGDPKLRSLRGIYYLVYVGVKIIFRAVNVEVQVLLRKPGRAAAARRKQCRDKKYDKQCFFHVVHSVWNFFCWLFIRSGINTCVK